MSCSTGQEYPSSNKRHVFFDAAGDDPFGLFMQPALREQVAKCRRVSPLARGKLPNARGELPLLRGRFPRRRGNRLLRRGKRELRREDQPPAREEVTPARETRHRGGRNCRSGGKGWHRGGRHAQFRGRDSRRRGESCRRSGRNGLKRGSHCREVGPRRPRRGQHPHFRGGNLQDCGRRFFRRGNRSRPAWREGPAPDAMPSVFRNQADKMETYRSGVQNLAKILFASSSVSFEPMSNHRPGTPADQFSARLTISPCFRRVLIFCPAWILPASRKTFPLAASIVIE